MHSGKDPWTGEEGGEEEEGEEEEEEVTVSLTLMTSDLTLNVTEPSGFIHMFISVAPPCDWL